MSKDWVPPQGLDKSYGIDPPQGVKGKGPIELPVPPPPPPPPPEMPLFTYSFIATPFPAISDVTPLETMSATPFLVAGDSANAINPTETISESVAVTETES